MKSKKSLEVILQKFSKQLMLSVISTTFSLYSCHDDAKREEASKIVSEWVGKQIMFPNNVPCLAFGQESNSELCDEYFHKEYKILLYVDSTGCSSCRMKLFEWKQLTEEADSLFPDKVGFLLFLQPKNITDIDYLFVRDRFDRPVFIDTSGIINRLNQFPLASKYNCFLLDGDNKVLALGNPVSNTKIWDLYKTKIGNGKKTQERTITSALVNQTEHNYGTIRKGSTNSADFSITNTGNNPLVISRVSTSCGCTNVDWEKQPINNGQTSTIRIEMKPDEIGHFMKTVVVYCNVNESMIKLTVSGMTIE